MKEDKGDLWGYPADYRCVTTNGVVKPNGKLVMGAGVALDAKRLFHIFQPNSELGSLNTAIGPFFAGKRGLSPSRPSIIGVTHPTSL